MKNPDTKQVHNKPALQPDLEELPPVDTAKGMEENSRQKSLPVSRSNMPVDFSLDASPTSTSSPVSIAGKNGLQHRITALDALSSSDDRSDIPIYYISDLHLEIQLTPILHPGITYGEIDAFLGENIKSMVNGIRSGGSVLMIGGDVANSVELTRMFYMQLSELWDGKIIAVLGNHELWDGHPELLPPSEYQRPLQEIIADYLNKEPYLEQGLCPPVILENALYIEYKNRAVRILSEDQILAASDTDLADLCEKSFFLVLGGNGFTGHNPFFNADLGLYRNAVRTLSEDQALSERFNRIYKKVLKCAETKRIIVLTHNPIENWSEETYHPHWIYINGHTHQNSFIQKNDGTTVFADNQLGYTPQPWRLFKFTLPGWCDPL